MDRHNLGTFAGLCGFIAKTAVGEVFIHFGFSKRSYRHTAAGVWVNSHRQANNWQGSLLGAILDAGLCK